MEIQYSMTAEKSFNGCNWTAYMRRPSKKTTLVFFELWSLLKSWKDKDFEELKTIINSHNFNSKAFHQVHLSPFDIDVCQYGVLPIVWICKDQAK